VAGAIAGRSFLTTGPALLFSLGNGAKPGDISPSGEQSFELTLASPVDIEKVEIVVNGEVMASLPSLKAGATKTYTGELNLPNGGWIAARAYSAEQRADSWPSMHARPFAHSSVIWINEVGSIDEGARKRASADLLRAINAAERQAREAYGERPMPRLYERFESARKALSLNLN
jgi:TolB protein